MGSEMCIRDSRYELDKARSLNGGDKAETEAKSESEAEGESEEAGEQTPAQVIGAFFLTAEENVNAAEQALLAADDAEAKAAAIGRIDSLIAHLATLKAGL